MKNIKLILAATVAAASLASAHDTPNALTDSQGNAVKGGFDQCIESVYNEPNASCGHKVAPPPPQQIHEVGFNLGAHALFDTAKSVLRSGGRAQLDDLAAKIQQGRELGQIKSVTGVIIVGHTDSRGSNKYNQGLSERRAASVRNYLVQKGVNPGIISAQGEGEMNPIADNKTPAGRQKNRRVNVTVQGVAVRKSN